MKVIHYGAKTYNSSYFLPIKNIKGFKKPAGGLWTSPIDSKYGWKEWCHSTKFMICEEENSFTLELEKNAKIFIINCLEDLIALPRYDYKIGNYSLNLLDFKTIAKSYDAIWLTANGERKTRSSNPNLYGWDCESVLILNSKIIKL